MLVPNPQSLKGERAMAEFFEAAFPWIVTGLFVAVSCVLMSRKK